MASHSSDGASGPTHVHEAAEDIAVNDSNERMQVDLVGRQYYQKVFVRVNEKGKKNNTSYDGKEKGLVPKKSTTSNDLLPTRAEIESRRSTDEVMIVGLVIVEDPFQYSTRGKGKKDKARQEAQDLRGVLPRADKVFRAAIAVTDYIEDSGKFYVLVDPRVEIYDVRTIKAEAIFYYSEFRRNVDDKVLKADRPTALAKACRIAAARIKESAKRPQRQLGDAKGYRSSNLFMSTPYEDAASRLSISWSVYQKTEDPRLLKRIEAAFKEVAPWLERNSHGTGNGVRSFLVKDTSFLIPEAEMMINELQAVYPDFPSVPPEIVVKVRQSLNDLDMISEMTGTTLPHLLHLINRRADVNTTDAEIKVQVEDALTDVLISEKYQTSRPSKPTSPLPLNDYRAVMEHVVHNLDILAKYVEEMGADIRKNHGAVGNIKSLEELMTRIGDAVCRTSVKLLHEQGLAIQGQLNAEGYTEIAAKIRDMSATLKETF